MLISLLDVAGAINMSIYLFCLNNTEKLMKYFIYIYLTHCILNRIYHIIYWKSPISILGTSGYETYIFLEKNG